MIVDQLPLAARQSRYLVALLPPSNVARAVADLQTELFRRLGLISGLGLAPLLPLAFSDTPPPRPARGTAAGGAALIQAGSLTTGGLLAAPAGGGDSPVAADRALYLALTGGERGAEGEGGSGGAPGAKGAARAGGSAAREALIPWLAELRASFPAGRGLFPLYAGLFLADFRELSVRAAQGAQAVPAARSAEAAASGALSSDRSLPAELAAISLPPPMTWLTSELACLALRFGYASRWWDFLEYETLWSIRLRRARTEGRR